jgi:molybdopterin biosynthesis enzyme MoaB
LQEALVSDTKDAHDAQGPVLSNLESQIQSNSQVIATVPDQLDQIRKHLQE